MVGESDNEVQAHWHLAAVPHRHPPHQQGYARGPDGDGSRGRGQGMAQRHIRPGKAKIVVEGGEVWVLAGDGTDGLVRRPSSRRGGKVFWASRFNSC